jgi:hypothetical protein
MVEKQGTSGRRKQISQRLPSKLLSKLGVKTGPSTGSVGVGRRA